MTHEVIAQVLGSIGSPTTVIGTPHQCRYCGETDTTKFRKVAHAFPESLGNKWVTCQDECDICNEFFSVYEDALAKAVAPFLTLGGTKGKGNKVRQTGRTAGNSTISHGRQKDGLRQISFANKVQSFGDAVKVDTSTGTLQFEFPIAAIPFSPRLAYKALVKIGLSLVPANELPHFTKLMRWIMSPDDTENFSRLNVGLSFSSIMNSPPLVVGALAKRIQDASQPYMMFFFCTGSLCFQIDLKSDGFDGPWPPPGPQSLEVRWTNIVGDGKGGEELKFEYGKPIQLNWVSKAQQPQPMNKITMTFDPKTGAGSFNIHFRSKTENDSSAG